jgi:hypothetical protein
MQKVQVSAWTAWSALSPFAPLLLSTTGDMHAGTRAAVQYTLTLLLVASKADKDTQDGDCCCIVVSCRCWQQRARRGHSHNLWCATTCMFAGPKCICLAVFSRLSQHQYLSCRHWVRCHNSVGLAEKQSCPTTSKGKNGHDKSPDHPAMHVMCSICAISAVCVVAKAISLLQNGKAQTWEQYRKSTEKDRQQLR